MKLSDLFWKFEKNLFSDKQLNIYKSKWH
jgi:hypothetical protein